MLIKTLFFYFFDRKTVFFVFYITVTEVKNYYTIICVSLLSRKRTNSFEGSIKYLS